MAIRMDVFKTVPDLYVYQVVSILSSFDLKLDQNTVALWKISTEDFYCIKWLLAALPSIQKYLKMVNLQLASLGNDICLLKENKIACTVEDITQLLTSLESFFVKKIIVFDYKAIADRVIKGCARAIELNCSYLDSTAIAKIHIEANVVSGAVEMIPYETKWCAWPDYGFVSMPDVNTLPDSHIDFMCKNLHNQNKKVPKGRFLAQYIGTCYKTPCHEVIHIIQGINKQRGNTFQAEHDASYSMMTLLWSISKLPDLSPLFIEGLCEMIYHYQIQSANRIWNKWNQSEKLQYHQWKDTFGLTSCPGWTTEGPEGLILESQMKTMIAAEGISPVKIELIPEERIKVVLDVLFKNRTGNILSIPVNIPADLKIEQNRIEKLVQPVSPDLLNELFKILQCNE